MSYRNTFAIIKPDAVAAKNAGNIIAMIEESPLTIVGMKYVHLTREKAEGFYAVHKERPFFGELVEFMIEGPIVVLALQGDDAVTTWRNLIGATNPADAAEGTIRKKYGESLGRNAVHGSDSVENAKIEVEYFFSDSDLVA